MRFQLTSALFATFAALAVAAPAPQFEDPIKELISKGCNILYDVFDLGFRFCAPEFTPACREDTLARCRKCLTPEMALNLSPSSKDFVVHCILQGLPETDQ